MNTPAVHARYVHTNIVANDWKNLVAFYETVFGCSVVPPRRSLQGDWLARGSGLETAALEGVHLRLPGYGDEGPTLEIFQFETMVDRPETRANRRGFGHIAFAVDDVKQALEQVVRYGGRAVGEVVEADVPGRGHLTFVYAADPEDNIIELQAWT